MYMYLVCWHSHRRHIPPPRWSRSNYAGGGGTHPILRRERESLLGTTLGIAYPNRSKETRAVNCLMIARPTIMKNTCVRLKSSFLTSISRDAAGSSARHSSQPSCCQREAGILSIRIIHDKIHLLGGKYTFCFHYLTAT